MAAWEEEGGYSMWYLLTLYLRSGIFLLYTVVVFFCATVDGGGDLDQSGIYLEKKDPTDSMYKKAPKYV